VKSRLKWYLPVLEVGVSLVLGLWGDWQTQRLLRQLGTSHVWDYVAPAEMVMHLINLPAMLACTLTLSRSFQIGIEYASVCGLSHFCCCALVFSGMVYPGLSPVGLFQTLYREGTASLRSSPRRADDSTGCYPPERSVAVVYFVSARVHPLGHRFHRSVQSESGFFRRSLKDRDFICGSPKCCALPGAFPERHLSGVPQV